jgi:hypothetical protein
LTGLRKCYENFYIEINALYAGGFLVGVPLHTSRRSFFGVFFVGDAMRLREALGDCGWERFYTVFRGDCFDSGLPISLEIAGIMSGKIWKELP